MATGSSVPSGRMGLAGCSYHRWDADPVEYRDPQGGAL